MTIVRPLGIHLRIVDDGTQAIAKHPGGQLETETWLFDMPADGSSLPELMLRYTFHRMVSDYERAHLHRQVNGHGLWLRCGDSEQSSSSRIESVKLR